MTLRARSIAACDPTESRFLANRFSATSSSLSPTHSFSARSLSNVRPFAIGPMPSRFTSLLYRRAAVFTSSHRPGASPASSSIASSSSSCRRALSTASKPRRRATRRSSAASACSLAVRSRSSSRIVRAGAASASLGAVLAADATAAAPRTPPTRNARRVGIAGGAFPDFFDINILSCTGPTHCAQAGAIKAV
jgi:hypothetical protein